MDPVTYFFWLAAQAIEVSFFFFPHFAVPAIIGLIISVVAAIRNPEPLRGKWLCLLMPFVIPIIILGYGVAFNYSGPIGSAPAWREQMLNVCVWSHVPVALVLVVVFRRNALVPLGLCGFLLWYSLGAAFMSSMSVTNVWL